MALIFSLNQEGALFKVKVTDCNNGNAISKDNITSQQMVFYKPLGPRFEKAATLENDTQKAGEAFVTYQNTKPAEESILDKTGYWEFAAQITVIPGNKVQTSQRFPFWVL